MNINNMQNFNAVPYGWEMRTSMQEIVTNHSPKNLKIKNSVMLVHSDLVSSTSKLE